MTNIHFLALSAALALTCACERNEPPPPSTPAEVTPAAPAPPAPVATANEPELDVPVLQDFEEEAEKTITAENLEGQLESVDKEIQSGT